MNNCVSYSESGYNYLAITCTFNVCYVLLESVNDTVLP